MDSHSIYANNFFKENAQVIQLAFTLVMGFGPLIYHHFYERNPEAEQLKIKYQKLSNEGMTLSNKDLEQKIDYNSDPEVKKNNKKLLAVKAVLQSQARWVNQELQTRDQELEERNKKQRITILQEIEMIKSWRSGDSLNKEKYDSIESGLLNRYNRLVHGVDFATVK